MINAPRSFAVALSAALLFAACGGSESATESPDIGEPVPDEVTEELDLSVDLDEIDADIEAEQEALDSVDLAQGFQCPTIGNQTVADLAPSQVARVSEGADGCIFYFGTSEIDPLRVDTYDESVFTDTAAETAAILQASSGGQAIGVPNALAAYLFEEGLTPENLPASSDDGSLEPGRQVIGYFAGTRGIRGVAVFPDAIVGMYDGSDAVRDEADRADFFVELLQNTVYAAG